MHQFDGNHETASRVISFDRYGIHDLGDTDDWIRKFERTRLGSRMVETEKSFDNLMPRDLDLVELNEVQLHRSHFFGGGFRVPYTHRPLSVPSLLYCAAEAVCLARPNLDFARLKNVIGFDIFDGIYDRTPPIEIHVMTG